MEETVSIKANCPVCKQDLSKVKAYDMGNGIFKCCNCGEAFTVEKLPTASACEIDGRYVI